MLRKFSRIKSGENEKNKFAHSKNTVQLRLMGFLGALLGASLVLSACGVGVKNGDKSQSAARDKSSKIVKAVDLPDPHTLTGVSEVPYPPDPKPVEGKFNQTLPVEITDEEGTKVKITDTSRILALDLYGTLSRIVIGLGLGDKIVGRSVASTETQLEDRPKVTEQGIILNAEAIISTKPSVIIMDRSLGPEEVVTQIRAAGIPVVITSSERKLADTGKLINQVAQALGKVEAGKALAKRAEAEIAAAKEKIATWTPEKPMRAVFLYVRGNAGVFFILGEKDGASELIESVGALDLAKANGIVEMKPATAEALVQLNPEVVFMMTKGIESTGGLEGLLNRPGMRQIEAGKRPRIISIPDGISLAFGPQSGETLEAVAKALYGVK